MASGTGKAAQPGPAGSAVNGTAADFANIDQELCEYQMHNKMCKKIAQLTKVRPAGSSEGVRTAEPGSLSRLIGETDGRLAVCNHTDRIGSDSDVIHSSVDPYTSK